MKIETSEQLGDMFTKGLAKTTFETFNPKSLVGKHISLGSILYLSSVKNAISRGSVDIGLVESPF